MAISLKKIQEVREKNNETVVIDLGDYIDPQLAGYELPIKVKSLEDTLQIQSNCKITLGEVTLDYRPFTRMPKSFRDFYIKSGKYRAGKTDTTYFQLARLDKDEFTIKRNKYRERLFNILIHIDMEYKLENGLTLWEDAGLSKGDYNGLVNLFSDIIKFEAHLDLFDIIIDKIKAGITDPIQLKGYVYQYGLAKKIESIEDETEKQNFIDNYRKALDEAIEQSEKMAKASEEQSKKEKDIIETVEEVE